MNSLLKILLGNVLIISLFTSCGNAVTEAVPADSVSDSIWNYDKNATILSLCFLSNISSGYIDSESPLHLQQQTKTLMENVLNNEMTDSCIGTWEIVWGPCITTDSTVDTYVASDLAMVLLKGPDPDSMGKPMYVISIAGTNNVSLYDWLNVDLNVTNMMKWPAVPVDGMNNLSVFSNPVAVSDTDTTNAGNYISMGMAEGMQNLMLAMSDSSSGEAVTLIEYLKTINMQGTPIELAVTGHSMGGALSPCVALSLKDNQGYWDTEQVFRITSYPFAGPSPGNAGFASYFTETIGADNFFGWYNTNDAAPHAFNSASMLTISSMYNNVAGFPQEQCLAEGIFSCLAQQVDGYHYTSLYNSGNSFTAADSLPSDADTATAGMYSRMNEIEKGVIDLFIQEFAQCTNISNDTVVAHFGCFGSLVVQQHFDAYRNRFNCQTVFDLIQRSQGPGPGSEKGAIIAIQLTDHPPISHCK